jgi:hypothetical protein
MKQRRERIGEWTRRMEEENGRERVGKNVPESKSFFNVDLVTA